MKIPCIVVAVIIAAVNQFFIWQQRDKYRHDFDWDRDPFVIETEPVYTIETQPRRFIITTETVPAGQVTFTPDAAWYPRSTREVTFHVWNSTEQTVRFSQYSAAVRTPDGAEWCFDWEIPPADYADSFVTLPPHCGTDWTVSLGIYDVFDEAGEYTLLFGKDMQAAFTLR